MVLPLKLFNSLVKKNLFSECFDFFLILIITIPRAATKFDDIRILEATAEVFGVFLDNSFAVVLTRL